MRTKAISTASDNGASRNRFRDPSARRKPVPMPRKLARSTKFVMRAR